MTAIAAEGKLTELSLVSSPCSRRPHGAELDASTVLGIQDLVAISPLGVFFLNIFLYLKPKRILKTLFLYRL